MSKSMIPGSLVESTHEYFVAQISRKSQAVYITTVLSFFAAFIAMPFIKVNVTVTSSGILRPMAERTEVKPLTDGMVEDIFVQDGGHVEAGNPIVRMQSDILENKIELLDIQIQEISREIADLEILVQKKKLKFSTALYQHRYAEYEQRYRELLQRKEKTKRELERNQLLFGSGAISEKDFDDYSYQYTLIEQEIAVFQENYKADWQRDLQKKRIEWEEINSKRLQLNRERNYSTIVAPISGNIEQFVGIYKGSVLQAGQTICQVSPDTALIAEVLVLPQDIAWLSVGNAVNLQIDAFNYSDWGMVHGQILDIANDFQLSNQTPVFKVRCQLHSQILTQNNGIQGVLKKGMTLNARFFVAERSLWQLLTDKTNDWLNPAMHRKEIKR